MGEYYVAVLELNAKHGVGKGFPYDALDFYRFFLGHGCSSIG